MNKSDTQRDPVEVLAAEFIERQRQGEPVTIDEYVTQYPDLADGIREFFPTMVALEKVKVRKKRSGDGRATLAGVELNRLNDFHIIREIDRGGMGIVFEAEEASLGRHVALKVLPRQSLLDERHLQRFQREAKTAANLHHTNIVPVFGVGECDGFHYYVMQLIPGVGLDQVLGQLRQDFNQQSSDKSSNGKLHSGVAINRIVAGLRSRQYPTVPSDQDSASNAVESTQTRHTDFQEFPSVGTGREPSYWHDAARLGIQSADALQYAHQQGLLHRDIKPANLLVDVQGNIWVADFGLAKALEHDDVSRPGEVVGTLRYIAPEQFAGATDARSDIYSLGLTMYEMLTLQPAYESTDRTQLMRQITEGQPPRPRKMNPRIPRDFETIVLKAISCDPVHRYQTARELAADLRRYIEDLPIHARRATTPERFWRWSRRNPAIASLSAIAVTLLLLVAVVASVGYVRESIQRTKTESTLATSLEALDKIYNRFAPDRIITASQLTVDSDDENDVAVPTQPVLSRDTAALLEEILPFYDRFAAESSNNKILRAEAAKANRRVGDIHQRLGQYEQSEAAYQRAIERYERLAAESTNNENHKTDIARIRNKLGNVYRAMRDLDTARKSYSMALQILQTIDTGSTSPAEVRYEMARTYYFLGKRDRPEPGDHLNRPPRGPRRGPPRRVADGPPPNRGQFGPPTGRPRGGPLNGERGPRDDHSHLDQAIRLLRELIDDQPSISEYRYLLALCQRERSRHFFSEGADRAIEILEELTRDFPAVADYRFELSETYAMIDVRRLRGDEWREAEARLKTALKFADALAREHPNVPDYAHARAHTNHKLGTVLRRNAGERAGRPSRIDESEAHQRQAIKIQSSLVQQFPKAWSYRIWLSRMQESLAILLRDNRRFEQARTILEASIAILDQTLEQKPELWFVHRSLFDQNRILAEILDRLGEREKATDARENSERHRQQFTGGSHRPPPERRHEIGPGRGRHD